MADVEETPAEPAPEEIAPPTEALPATEAPSEPPLPELEATAAPLEAEPAAEEATPKDGEPPTEGGIEKKVEGAGPEPTPDPTKKSKRRGSMFDEAANVQELMGQSGDITSTLQAFFKEASTSQEKLTTQKRLRRPKLIYENTYRLDSKKPFIVSRAESIIEKTLEEMLTGVKYNSKTSSALCCQIAEKIRNRLLVFDYDRYKLVVHVGLGPMNRQGFVMAFKHLGDPIRDFYAQGNFSNYTLFAVVSAHAVYFD